MLGVVALGAALASGCTQTSAGEPRPADPLATGSESTELTTDRPRELRLDGEDPCALVPESDWPAFAIDEPGESQTNRERNNSPECYYSGNDAGYFLTLVVTEGIGVWLDGSRAAEVEKTDPVAGYPAITLTIDLDPNRCDVVVDVADGQYLKVGTLPDQTEVPVSESCAASHELAELAISTLVGE